MIQPSTRLDQHEEVGSPPSAPARLYKPSVDERMRRIKDTRNLLREYGTVKELKLNLEALSWGQLTDLEDQLLHRKVSG